MSEPALGRHLTALAEAGLRSATLIHELRQPLFALRALSQLARAEGRSLDSHDIDQLLHLIQQLEQILEEHDPAGGAEVPRLFDLNESVHEAVQLLEPQRRSSGVRVDVRLSRQALRVHGRPGAARRVVVNLVRNALDAVEDREVRRVLVSSDARDGEARVVVLDTGAGIPDAVRPQLFEPFVSSKPPGRGTGLGLYVARRLVQEARGHIELVCPDEGGTRAEIRFPIGPQQAEPATDRARDRATDRATEWATERATDREADEGQFSSSSGAA